MGQISRPMQIVLAVTLLFAAAWFVVLRPKDGAVSSTPAPSASSSSTAPGVKGLGRAVDKAKGAVATSEQQARKLGAASAAASGTAASATPAPSAASAAAPAPAAASTARTARTGPTTVVPGATTGGSAVARPNRALAHHKVLVMLFYNPRAADDR